MGGNPWTLLKILFYYYNTVEGKYKVVMYMLNPDQRFSGTSVVWIEFFSFLFWLTYFTVKNIIFLFQKILKTFSNKLNNSFVG